MPKCKVSNGEAADGLRSPRDNIIDFWDSRRTPAFHSQRETLFPEN